MKKLYLLLVPVLLLAACKKENKIVPVLVNKPGINISVAIDVSQPGYKISPIFEGLSFETGILSHNPEYLTPDNAVMVNLIKNIGPGLLRIGGDTSDEIDWTGTERTDKSTPDSLTRTEIKKLGAFSKAVGWPVLFGLNMGSYKVAAAADEAKFVYNTLGSNLYAFQPGNEPDIYHSYGLRSANYGVFDYESDWDNYYSAIKKVVPDAAFTGPDVANNTQWVKQFALDRADKINLIDAHYYQTGPASNPAITYFELLRNDYLPMYLYTVNGEAIKHNLPYRITETNNIYGGGKQGASDVFASALWALDLMWNIAKNNGQGVNFHDGHGLFYSPITMANGIVTAHPEYYAMLAFKYGNIGGHILPVNNSTADYNFHAFASLNSDNSTSVTIINEEDTNDINFTVKLNKNINSIQIARLTAPKLNSTDQITFAGSTINADGSFAPVAQTSTVVNQDNFLVKIPAGSAAVITMR